MKKSKNIILIIFLSLVFSSCVKSNNDNILSLETIMNSSIVSYNVARIEILLTFEEIVVYSKVIDIVKDEDKYVYSLQVKELADNLYASSIYDTYSLNGTLTKDEAEEFFPKANTFDKKRLSDYKVEEGKITFKVDRVDAMEVFGIGLEDINKISKSGVDVEFVVESDKLQAYSYKYIGDNGLIIKIKGEFFY